MTVVPARALFTMLFGFTALGCEAGSEPDDGDRNDDSGLPALSLRWDLSVRPEVEGIPNTAVRLVLETAAEKGLGNHVEALELGDQSGNCNVVPAERMPALAPDALTAIECGLADVAEVTRVVRQGTELLVIQ